MSSGLYTTHLTSNKEVYRSEMDVFEMDFARNVSCYGGIEVFWGAYYDTMAVSYQGVSLRFYSVGKKNWEKGEKQKTDKYLNQWEKDYPEVMRFVLQDEFNDKYMISISTISTGVLLIISNIDRGFPTYVFCTKDLDIGLCDQLGN